MFVVVGVQYITILHVLVYALLVVFAIWIVQVSQIKASLTINGMKADSAL